MTQNHNDSGSSQDHTPKEPRPKRRFRLGIFCAVLAVICVVCFTTVAIWGAVTGIHSLAQINPWNDRHDVWDRDWVWNLADGISSTVQDFANGISDVANEITEDYWNAADTSGLVDKGFTATIEPDRIQSIDIDMIVGNIMFLPAVDDQIKVEYTALLNNSLARRHSTRYDDSGNTIVFNQTFRSSAHIKGRNKFALTVYIPEKSAINVYIKQVNGNISIDGDALGDLTIRNINGSISVALSQADRIDTTLVNGKTNVALYNSLQPEIHCDATNGEIVLSLHPMAAFRYAIHSLNGSIRMDQAFGGMEGRFNAGGTVGEGQGDVELSTVNGSVEVEATQASLTNAA